MGALLAANFTVPQVFLITGLLNAVVAFYIVMLVPGYLLRFVAFMLTRLVYRFKVRGDENIPTTGAAILVCNHVSFVDAVLLMAASPRPIRFIMDQQIFKMPVLGWFFKLAKAIPIAPQRVYPVACEQAFVRIRERRDARRAARAGVGAVGELTARQQPAQSAAPATPASSGSACASRSCGCASAGAGATTRSRWSVR